MKIGNVVQLKSGGPKMTVITLEDNAAVGMSVAGCMWFEGTRQKSGKFPEAALRVESADVGAEKHHTA